MTDRARALVALGAALALPGCAGWVPVYIEASGGAIAGASEVNGFGAGPVVALAFGFYIEPDRSSGPLDVGLGLGNEVGLQDFDGFERPLFLSGFATDVAVPVYALDPTIHLRWHAMLVLGGGAVAVPDPMGGDPSIEGDFAGSLFSGLGFSFSLGGRWEDMPNYLSIAIGPYGAFFAQPAGYGGGLLKLRLYLHL